jgi:methionyl-tRNA synthetase
MDGDFSEPAFRQRYNSHLANDLGNLCSRTLSMIDRYAAGRIPPRTSSAKSRDDDKLHQAAAGLGGKIGAAMGELAFHKALMAIWEVVDLANRYIEITAPWNLDKQVSQKRRLSTVLYNLAESLHLIALYLYPFMPETAERILTQLGIRPSFDTLRLSKRARVGSLRPGTLIRKGDALFPRLEGDEPASKPARPSPQAAPQTAKEKEQKRAPAEASKPPSKSPSKSDDKPAPDQVTISEFSRLELRVARILSAERIAGSNKLLKLRVSLGQEERQVVAGIGTKYEPDQIIGKQVVILANLKPAKIMGVESQGMLLAAGDTAVESLLTLLEEVPEGAKIK